MLGGQGVHLFWRLSNFIVFYNSGSGVYLQSVLGHLILSFICVKLSSQIWCIASLPCYYLGKKQTEIQFFFPLQDLRKLRVLFSRVKNVMRLLEKDKGQGYFYREILYASLLWLKIFPSLLSHYLKPSFCAQSTLQVLESLVSAANISSAGPVVVGHRSFPT